jgi:hypothetical protein
VLHGFSYPNYLKELGADAQSEIYEKSSVDLAMRDAFRKMRHFLMTTQGLSEDEAISLMSVAVDFGRDPGGGRQLGRARRHQEEHLRRQVSWQTVRRARRRGGGEGPASRGG